MTRLRTLGLALLTVFMLGNSTTDSCPPPTANLGIKRVPQEQPLWCWAAVGQLTMNYVSPASNVTQCDEANKAADAATPTCCQAMQTGVDPYPQSCKLAGFPDYHHYMFDALNSNPNPKSQATAAPLSWPELQRQIGCLGVPVAFAWHYAGTGGHMMTAVGYDTVDDVNFVVIDDSADKETQGPEVHEAESTSAAAAHAAGAPALKGEQTYITYDAYKQDPAAGPGHPATYLHWVDYSNIKYVGN